MRKSSSSSEKSIISDMADIVRRGSGFRSRSTSVASENAAVNQRMWPSESLQSADTTTGSLSVEKISSDKRKELLGKVKEWFINE